MRGDMLIAETALSIMVGVQVAAAGKGIGCAAMLEVLQPTVKELPVFTWGTLSMEDFVKSDIGSVAGVRSVRVERDGNRLYADICMRDLEFSTCKPVYEKELAIYTEFPALDFSFNVRAA